LLEQLFCLVLVEMHGGTRVVQSRYSPEKPAPE
jgi:hypothetical protein